MDSSSAHSQSESGTQALLVRWAWGGLTLRKVFHLAVLCLSWSIGLRELVLQGELSVCTC